MMFVVAQLYRNFLQGERLEVICHVTYFISPCLGKFWLINLALILILPIFDPFFYNFVVFILRTEFRSVCMCTILGKMHRDIVDMEPSHEEVKTFITDIGRCLFNCNKVA